MATLFLYGPYVSVSDSGLPPGAQETWFVGPWPWSGAVVVTAHPLALAGADRTMTVTSVTSQAAPNGDRFIFCTFQNVGVDPANYVFWVGGATP
jgi:hypothetical protein